MVQLGLRPGDGERVLWRGEGDLLDLSGGEIVGMEFGVAGSMVSVHSWDVLRRLLLLFLLIILLGGQRLSSLVSRLRTSLPHTQRS